MNNKLRAEDLPAMNTAQQTLVTTQWEKHQHNDFTVDYDMSGEGDVLKEFLIQKNVWNPLMASGRYHARYFFYHNGLYLGKTAIEIGCGTGIVGIVMAKCGAKKVIMTDVSPSAVKNTQENINRYDLRHTASVFQSNLFENIKEKADLITWMIPFFSDHPTNPDSITASMIMPPELFERFLQEAPNYLNKGGVIVLPSYDLGGDDTNPAIIAPRFGYQVETTWSHCSINGLQQGMLYMHELRRE